MLRRIWAVTQKEFIQFIRDRQMLVALLIGPVLELVLFAAAIHTDVQHIPMVVADQSLSSASRSYISAFTSSGSFTLVATLSNQAQVVQAIDSGKASLGLVIPPDFAARLSQKDANVLMLVDGSSSFVTQSASTAADAISQQYAVSLDHQGFNPLVAHFRILFNPDLQDMAFILPGMISFLMYGIALKLTAFSIVREREMGTIEALLVTPVRPIELMIAKTLPNLCIAILNFATALVLGIFIYHLPFRGNFPLYFALLLLFSFTSLGLGMAISSLSQTQIQANQAASLLNIIAIFLSGFMFPTYALPAFLRLVSYLFPLTFFVPITNGIFTKGIGLNYLWGQVLAMIGLTGLILFVGVRFFRQRLD